MVYVTLMIMAPEDVDLGKVHWQFWQKSNSYEYGSGLVCLFFLNRFALYQTFIMSNGRRGIDRARPKAEIIIPLDGIEEDAARIGISEVFNKYLNDLNKQAINH